MLSVDAKLLKCAVLLRRIEVKPQHEILPGLQI